MANYLVNDTQLTSVADAIRAKSGGNTGLAFPSGFISEIGNISSGGGGGAASSGNDVIFYDDLMNDCRGGVAYSYSAADFAKLTEMPANPDHSNFVTHGISIPMTSQGWNWSLAKAKAYVAKYGKLNIGQTYIPTDGKSHWICHVPEDAPVERWNTVIHISVIGGSVNWQVDDGTTDTADADISVTFPSVGWHDVKISVPNGVTYSPYYESSTQSNELIGKIQKTIQVFFGDGVATIGDRAFYYYYYSLTFITIPNGVASIGSSAFQNCYSLTSIIISGSVTSISFGAFQNCYSLTSIIIPDSITIICGVDGTAFQNCYRLTSINIPDGVTSIGGSNAFQNCYALASITIPDSLTKISNNSFQTCYSLTSITIPNGVTNIYGNAFQNCYSLTSVNLSNSITSVSSSAFTNCYSLTSVNLSNSITSISSNMFSYCYSLTSITIPDSVTSIGSYAFQNCRSLTSITIPDDVTNIDGYVFYQCYSLKTIIMEGSTPPTLSSTSAFSYSMPDYTIIVPAGSRESYIAATNWSSLADHIVEATT